MINFFDMFKPVFILLLGTAAKYIYFFRNISQSIGKLLLMIE